MVAEMTGRRGRVVKTEKQPHPHYEARESDSSNVDSLNIQEVRERCVIEKSFLKVSIEVSVCAVIVFSYFRETAS